MHVQFILFEAVHRESWPSSFDLLNAYMCYIELIWQSFSVIFPNRDDRQKLAFDELSKVGKGKSATSCV
jgi:hypothetical protein